VGLSLDYDVFLISRVVEYRTEGRSDAESVLLGLAKTGRIITAAGLIMAIAFFGLLLSDQSSMNQLSFFLVVSVLVGRGSAQPTATKTCATSYGRTCSSCS